MKTTTQKRRNGVAAPNAEPELALEALVAAITEENRHGETDTADAVGCEVW